MQKRNVLNSPRLLELKRKKRRIIITKILICLFSFLVVAGALAYISRLDRLNISGVEITGNRVVDTEVIQAVVEKEITGHYLWVFPKTNILLFPKNRIKNGLNDQLKRLKDITLTIKDRKTLAVSVTERTGKYIWCGNTPNLGLQIPIEQCYFLDEDGYIFDEAPYFSGEVYFKFYGSVDSPSGTPAGAYFFKDNFKQLILFKERLAGMGLNPVMLYKEDTGNIKMFLSKRNTLPSGPEVIFRTDSNLENIAENLKAALDTEPLKSEFKNKYRSLQYIDLRFENKVYYKFE